MNPPRPIPLAVAVLALAAVGVLCVAMARRIVRYNTEQGRIVYVFMQVTDTAFNYAGVEASFTETAAPKPGAYGAVEVRYGDELLSLPITMAPSEFADRLPGLTRYEDWMKVVRFAPLTGRGMDDLLRAMDSGEEQDRLALVVKSIRPGVKAETWGRVWRKDWVFDFYEFLPGGEFRHERFAYPKARKLADAEAAKEEEGGVPELDSRSWQFQAADLLMPEGSAPRIIAGDSPLVATGWVFPAAVVSTIVATVALLFAFAPARIGSPAPVGSRE